MYKFEREIKIKENGKPMIKLSRKCSGTLGRMRTTRSNIIISEQRINPKSPVQDRSFTLVIRNDGVDGEYKMGQLSFLKEEDLIQIRDSIDLILNLDNVKVVKEESKSNVTINNYYIQK